MTNEMKIKNIELILRKLNWVNEIIVSTQESSLEAGTTDILSAVQFIVNSATEDAEELYQKIASEDAEALYQKIAS